MLTYWLQWVDVLCALAFALAALRIGRGAEGGRTHYGRAWHLTGAAFLLHAAVNLVQLVWGGIAIRGGASSGAMESYLRWAPAMNHGRTFLLLAFCGTLLVFCLRRPVPGKGFVRGCYAALGVATVAGGALGFMEGSLLMRRHFLAVAAWDTVELIALLAALLGLLLADRADRLLWGALATYAFSVALSILWFTALSRMGITGAWAPAPWTVAAYRAATMLVTLFFAVWRLRALRLHQPVPSLNPAQRGLAAPSLG